MSDDRWRPMWEIFHAALERPRAARESYVAEACGADRELHDRVLRLLASHERPPGILDEAPPIPAADPLVGGRIGPYRIVRVGGEGGMGVVYEAEQEHPLRRRVALKLIRPGMDTREFVARFEAERQALALMEHPSVARVFDGGATPEGRPYFVMEYVVGLPITEHCDARGLDVRERLRLFLEACEGVQHAHQRGIIHRDLKPSNVLVAEQDGKPVPKIIDFGVAKAAGPRLTDKTMYTSVEGWIGTPEYMSPEQAESGGHDVDTRTDVYGLGMILYELLVGALPFEEGSFRRGGLDEVRRRIRDEEPTKPSARLDTLGERASSAAERRRTDVPGLRKRVAGDLDWVVMKALEKDRARRYPSVAALADDLSRHLRDEPVLAGPPSAAYRLRKFVRRHRVPVAAGLAAIAVLVAVAVLMTVQAGRIARERDRANQEAERAGREARTAREVSDFLVGLFKVSDPTVARGNTVTAREILDRGRARLGSELGDEPEVRARLLSTFGEVYFNLGLYDESATDFEEALRIRRELHGEDHPEVADSLERFGALKRTLGHYAEAEALYVRALEIRESAPAPDEPAVARTLDQLAVLLRERGRTSESLALYERALAAHERIHGPEGAELSRVLRDLGFAQLDAKDFASARTSFRRALAIAERVEGPDGPGSAFILHGLSIAHWEEKDLPAARRLLERCLGILERIFSSEHPYTLSMRQNLARILHDEGNLDAAQPIYEHVLAEQERLFGPDHPDVAIVAANLGGLLRDRGDPSAAEPHYVRAIRILEDRLGPEHPRLARPLDGYAKVLRLLGRAERAEALERRAAAIREP